METVRVDICYRPLRLGWAIRAGDMDGFRTAVRLSFALWGGRFNPIIVVDQPDQAESLIEVFRVDLILPIGDSEAVTSFPKRFPYLIKPFFHDGVFIGDGDGDGGAWSQVLDIHNALAHMQGTPELTAIKEHEMRIYTWEPDDPLADAFLVQFGGYPSADEIHIDYRKLVIDAVEAKEVKIDAGSELPADIFEHPTISSVSRLCLERHYSVPMGWDTPGFYSGGTNDFNDLVCYWNLRAADISLLFVDPNHLDRYKQTMASWGKAMQNMVSRRRHEFDRRIAVWVREDSPEENTPNHVTAVMKPFANQASMFCTVREGSWNGLNVRPPMMHLGQVSTLGVMSTKSGTPEISFALDNKPFSDDSWFHTQALVASLSFVGGLYGDEQHTLAPPFVPELNEFYARTIYFHYDKVRSESGRIGLVIGACDTTASINAMPVGDLVERIFDLAGFSARLSAGGLIARQLIAQLGGVDGARAFKIPGVRRLLKTHGPTAAFTKDSALQLIGGKDPDNPTATFKDYRNLYIESRPAGVELEPEAVFTYLVEKRLFRIGAELACPHCRMSSWTALDALRQQVTCELCGHEFDATRQLVKGAWHYRRSGVLGAEKNAQGAVPVVLTLQQFTVNLRSLFQKSMYSPSLDLRPKEGTELPECEIDFVWLIPQVYPEKTIVMIGECKDRGGGQGGESAGTINAIDIDHLKRVADALPTKRFKTFIVLAKLCPFTAEEIALARTLNEQYRRRAILLTARELEPYHFYERTKLDFKTIRGYGGTADDLATATAEMYFRD